MGGQNLSAPVQTSPLGLEWTPARSSILAVLLILACGYLIMAALRRRRSGDARRPENSAGNKWEPAFKRASLILGVIVAVGGALVLVGWTFHIAFLQRVRSDYVSMKANTALTLALAGIALCTIDRRVRNRSAWLTTTCSAFVGLMGILTLIEYQTGWNLHIDRLLFREQAALTTAANPGRMAFSTALAFLLIGVALVLVRRPRFVAQAQSLAMATGLLSLMNLVSYFYGIKSDYGIAIDISMAVHTALFFLLLSLGILAYRAGDGLMQVLSSASLGGVMGRRLMPAAVLLPVALGWLLWRGQLAGLYDAPFGTALFACGNVALFCFLIWNSADFLERLALARSQIERERDELHRQLRESEHHYRQVVESLPQMVWTCLPDGKPDYFSHRWAEYTGVPQDGEGEFRSSPQVHSDDRDRLLERWRAVVESGVNFDEEYRLRNAAGEYRWFRDLAAPLRDSNGAIVKWFGTSTDIHNMKTAQALIRSFNQDLEKRVQDRTGELRSANEQLSQTRNRLQTILDSAAQVAIIALDCEGIVQLFNTGAEQLLGYAAVEVIGKHSPRLFLSPESFERRAAEVSKRLGRSIAGDEVFAAASSGREARTIEEIYRRRDGVLLNVDLAIAPVFDERGDRVGTLGIASDVTQRRSLELRLTEMNAELREQTMGAQKASRAKSDFLANMSHEIRTPMNGVIGMTGLLLDTSLSTEQRDYAETIRYSADALLSIINDILDFSKMEGGNLTIEPIRFDLATTVQEVVELLAPRATEKGLDLIFEYTPNAPHRVLGDPGRIRQVLINLAGNSIKFTKTGHVFIRIEYLDQGLPVPIFRFSVEDTGIGIAAQKLGNVFDRFTQADTSTTRTYGGTGLGLAISKQLVELMGGKMTVSSQPGEGSSFTFALPLPLDQIVPRKPSLGASLSGARVLVVDDIPLNLRVVSEQLASRQVEHVCAASAREALQILRTAHQTGHPFHIAILDHLMPEMDGEMLGRAIKADPDLRSISLLLLTSSGQKSDRARFEAAGFSAYLVKPARVADLVGALAALWGAVLDGIALTEIVTRHSLAETLAADRKLVNEPEVLPFFHLLVVDDNLINQKVAKRLLEKSGCQVDVAANGIEAVDMWGAHPYAAIFMDCQMPEMDGFEATSEIRRRERVRSPGRHTPIVALTAAVMAGDREKCLAAGMDDFLSKPIQPATLRGVLERWVWPQAEQQGSVSERSHDRQGVVA
jgi:PAS domain S-box-containing protein